MGSRQSSIDVHVRPVCLLSYNPFLVIRLTGVILRALGVPSCGLSYWGDSESAGGTQLWLIVVPPALTRNIDMLVCAGRTPVGTLVTLCCLRHGLVASPFMSPIRRAKSLVVALRGFEAH